MKMLSKAKIDQLWQRAMLESVKKGDKFTRYQFVELLMAEIETQYEADVNEAYHDGLIEASPEDFDW